MPFEMRRQDDVVIVTMTPECTPEDLVELERRMGTRLETGTHHLLIHLNAVEYAGSSFVGRLLAMRKMIGSRGGQTILLRPSRILQRVLEALGLDEIFRIVASEEDALRELRGDSSPS